MTWDNSAKARGYFIAWLAERMAEAARVIRPGHYALVWALPRTSHWTACALEDAGWTLVERIAHVFGCLSEDTEILTDKGWEQYQKLVEGSMVLAYNVDGDTFQWERVNEVFVYDHAETAYAIRSPDTDQLVSRNHRCLVGDGDGYRFIPAEEAALEREIYVPILEDVRGLLQALPLPQCGPGEAEPVVLPGLRQHPSRCGQQREEKARSGLSSLRADVPSEEAGPGDGQISLLRISVCGGGKGGGPDFSGTSQGGRFDGSGGMDGGIARVLSGQDDRREQSRMEGRGDDLQDARQLRRGPLCPVSAGIPDDGPQGWICDGASLDRREDDRSLPAQGGGRPSRRSRSDQQRIGQPATLRQQSGPQTARASRFARPDLATIEPVHYEGVVWCVRVPSGAFVARRNGKVFVTGNSGFPKAKSRLKPAVEDWWLCRAPGGGKVRELNIDQCRVAIADMGSDGRSSPGHGAVGSGGVYNGGWAGDGVVPSVLHPDSVRHDARGRWPSNLVLTHSAACRPAGTRVVRGSHGMDRPENSHRREDRTAYRMPRAATTYVSPDGTETVEAWLCSDDCPVRQLDVQSGERTSGKAGKDGHRRNQPRAADNVIFGGGKGLFREAGPAGNLYGDSGGASRFFPTFAWDEADFFPLRYCPKASKSDRGEGNTHNTVKPQSLMRWLAKLITPENGTILDPFMGSGTTGLACMAEGFGFVGIESDPEYHRIASRRLAAAAASTPLFAGVAPSDAP